MKTYKLPSIICPECGYDCNRASPMPGNEGHKPRPGDLTICISCGAFATFTDKLDLELVSDRILDDAGPYQRRLLVMARHFIRKRGPIERNTKQ